MSRRRDSSNESEEGKLELPLNTISIVESNPFIIDSLKEIFDDLNPETTRNKKVRSIMMIKDIDPKTRQQAVMAVMQGKKSHLLVWTITMMIKTKERRKRKEK